MLKVVGVQRKTGVYEGNNYDNLVLHCLNDETKPPCIAGAACEIVKVKFAEVGQVFGGLIKTDQDFRSLIGMAITPFYDRYGRVLRADISEYIERG